MDIDVIGGSFSRFSDDRRTMAIDLLRNGSRRIIALSRARIRNRCDWRLGNGRVPGKYRRGGILLCGFYGKIGIRAREDRRRVAEIGKRARERERSAKARHAAAAVEEETWKL